MSPGGSEQATGERRRASSPPHAAAHGPDAGGGSSADASKDLKELPLAEVEKQLESSPAGLTAAEAKKRLARYGPNAQARPREPPPPRSSTGSDPRSRRAEPAADWSPPPRSRSALFDRAGTRSRRADHRCLAAARRPVPDHAAVRAGADRGVSGFERPRVRRRSAANRPNSISRVLPSCSSRPKLANRSRSSDQNRSASSRCSKPTTKSSANRTTITSPRARRRLHWWTHRSNT